MQTITALIDTKQHIIHYDPSDHKSLSRILKDNGIMLNTSCGECGICNKCSVILCQKDDRRPTHACTLFPDTDISIIIPESSLIHSYAFSDSIGADIPTSYGHIYASADIGSTSITICIHDDTETYLSTTLSNPTCAWGADIISRIKASINGNEKEISSALRRSINDTIKRLLKRLNVHYNRLSRFTISCNNTMQHILLGLDCTPISTYPFASFNLCFDPITYNKLFSETDFDASVYIIPSFDTFIGGDIVSGLYSLDVLNSDNNFLLLDLGTNAEMVIGNRSRMLCTSAASGPAFEAGGLSCGCAYTDGAIDTIKLKKYGSRINISYTTAGDKIPIGICGSGVLSLLSQLAALDIINEYGTLSENYADSGFFVARMHGADIILTQDDIRQLQLAISAIKSGIHILLSESGMSVSDIDKVYISGSFGASLDFATLNNLHIFPDEWMHKPDVITPSGNTSLNGAIKYSRSLDTCKYIDNIISKLSMLHLSNHPDFNELFIKNINFHS